MSNTSRQLAPGGWCLFFYRFWSGAAALFARRGDGVKLNSGIMQTTITLRRIVAHPCFSLACVLAVFFILPQFGGAAVTVGCAVILSAFVSAQPERFRSRRGSMRLAIGLVIAMWLAAAVVTALTLTGGLRD